MCYMNYTMGSVGMCNLEFHHHRIILSSLIFIIEHVLPICVLEIHLKTTQTSHFSTIIAWLLLNHVNFKWTVSQLLCQVIDISAIFNKRQNKYLAMRDDSTSIRNDNGKERNFLVRFANVHKWPHLKATDVFVCCSKAKKLSLNGAQLIVNVGVLCRELPLFPLKINTKSINISMK